jgi:hypothetical protein
MNKLIFTKLYVDGEEISRHQLAEPIRDLVEAAYLIFRSPDEQPTPPAARRGAKPTNANSPAGEGGAA